MNHICKLVVALPLFQFLGGCATITRGTSQAFVIESEPPGATAKLSSGVQCITPCALNLKRKNGFTVEIVKNGYEPVNATVTSGVSGGGAAGMAGNVILGGLIGAVVDGTNGSMNDLMPNPLRVNLVPLSAAPTSSQSGTAGAEVTASSTVPRTLDTAGSLNDPEK